MTEIFVNREEAVKELMTAVRRNTCPSKCVENFGKLLLEIQDEEVVKTVMDDVSGLITGARTLFTACDRVGSEYPSIVSRMLTDDFINPSKYFNKTRKIVKDYLLLSYTMNTIKFSKGKYGFKSGFQDKVVRFNFGKTNKLGDIQNFSENCIIPHDFGQVEHEKGLWAKKYDLTSENFDAIQEECRKVILLWNHLPAVYKAMMQTRRRGMGLDRNSKKFV